MTEEEMAEEWVKQEYPTLQLTAVAQRYIKAFLAGLKAGRPQWYKPSEKLPESCTIVQNENGERVFYDGDIKSWRYDDADLNISLPPVAWCEIPTFDKE